MKALIRSSWWINGVVLMALFMVSCKPKKLQSPPHYDFKNVTTVKLDPRMREISGIVWDTKANVFIANNDEEGKLYFLEKETKKVVGEFPFGDKGDYEDVTIYNGTIYILKSDGSLTRFVRDSSGKSYGVDLGKIGLAGTNDFETLYTDPSRKALIMICKNCAADDEKTVSAFAYYPDSIGFDTKPVFHIDAEQVRKISPFRSSEKFQPSAAAIHPILHKLFILSAASRQLAIADTDGHVESVFKLSSQVFPQPEGITFKQNGAMFISNEGRMSKSTLLSFAYEDSSGTVTTPAMHGAAYDFNNPDEKMELGKQLHEISGMAYIPRTGLILGENDEKGDIFTIDFKNRKDNVDKEKFGGKGDYEDIVYTDTAVYMLISSGSIVKVETKDSSFETEQFDLPGDKNEFETLYMSDDHHSLIMLCKECAHEKKTDVRTAYRFDLEKNKFDEEPAYSIDISAIRKMLKDDEALFKPSAAAINPINGKLYIVASVGKLLVVASKDGRPEQVYKLDPKMFNQPEGMTIAPNGDLYISNEGGDGVATILKFKYRK